MKLAVKFFTILSVIVGACSGSKTEKKTPTTSALGELQYAIPVSEAAKPHFDQGLLLLHSFEYDDARESFEKAIQADSTEIMGFWGVAMSHYKALWGLQNIPAGRATMARIADTKSARLETASEGLERDLWKGIEILYGEGELTERNQKYTDHMAELHAKYENSQEVAAFYALALMWSASIDADDEVYKMSANVAKGILEENPNHPGAVHYIIHAYDNPELAHLAIDAANKYAVIAPDAWLHYGYLQQGRYQKASELLKDMLTYTERTQSNSARSYLLKMQSMQVSETGSWPLTDEYMVVKTEDIGIEKQAQQHFFLSLMNFKNDNGSQIQYEIDSLQGKINTAELLVTSAGIAMCSAGPTRYAPNKNSIANAKTMLHQMNAMLALSNNDEKGAEEHFKAAIAIESEAEYAYGPPEVVYPSFEQYGNWLMEKGRYEEALEQFDISLKRAPLRAMALQGKIKALEALGKSTEVETLQLELDKFWQPDGSVS